MENEVLSDNELLRLARQLDDPALARIYDLFSPGLYRYAIRLLGDRDLAEDCVADTFTRFLHTLQDGRSPETHLQAYLYRIAHNWIVDFYRREPGSPRQLTEEQPDPRPEPEEDVDHRWRQGRLQQALRRLTMVQQQVIALKYLEDWENEEIACVLKKPVGAIKSLQHRALAALKRHLVDEDLI